MTHHHSFCEISIINLAMVHLVFFLFAAHTERTGNPLTVVLNHAISCINATIAHILPGLIKQRYNPGLLQSLFMAPFSAVVLYKFYLYQEKSLKAVLICVLFGSAYGHGIALLLPLKLTAMGILNELGFLIWSLTALILFPAVATRVLNPVVLKKGD
mmetsp:Transcript_37900/g.91901  ORF Transcript_37900/g.91901 Transcript_37900/m.91901 type:complete len:157 (+) Transcript_37900:212-682(+)